MKSGVLRTWHDDKGFGFIAPSQGGRVVFVHISAFPRDGSRPTVGERLMYALGQDQEGRPRATKVMREALVSTTREPARPRRAAAPSRLGLWILALALLTCTGVFYMLKARQDQRQGIAPAWRATGTAEAARPAPALPAPPFPAPSNAAPSSLARSSLARSSPAPSIPAATVPASTIPAPSFTCDGRRYCSQMTSCAEATYFLKHCPGAQMDGDHDGVPCEKQWCTHPFSK